MTNHFFLDWAMLAVSLANVILLLWLGLTILLNAGQRTRGVWLASSGLLLGALFFISHSAILGYGLEWNSAGLNLWWRIGWLPLAILPFTWYMVMLWYAGCWADGEPFPHRQRVWFGLMGGSCLGIAGWLALAHPLPSFTQAAWLDLSTVPVFMGWPVFLIIYPVYLFCCVGPALSLLGLDNAPDQGRNVLGRKQARPWLVATSAVLLLVAFLVGGVIVWILAQASLPIPLERYPSLAFAMGCLDVLIASLIGGVTILLGQAIVSFEVFTEKALPRGEFQRQWRNAIILAIGYSLVVSWGLTLQIRPIYVVLLTTLLMALFFALWSWRAYAWRERYLRHLRPFMASQRLYDQLLASAPSEVRVELPFQALCDDVLHTEFACLIPLGPLAPLVRPLNYPQANQPLPLLPKLVATFQSPDTICLPLEPEQAGGALWAIPLWSERGLIGVLLLGPKRDRGLYTQEEIEIARASGERLIDTQASAEIAQGLMRLQRQRLVESQVLDRQTRRVLHDDILPDLHTALLMLNGSSETAEAARLLTQAHHRISNLLREMPAATVPHLERLGLIGALAHVVTDELPGAFDRVTWQIEPEARQAATQLSSLTTHILFYAAREAIRNAAKHGRNGHGDQPLSLTVSVSHDISLAICIEDDGVGLVTPATPSPEGSGQGLALHSTMLAVIGGSLNVESLPGAYTRVTVIC